MPTLSQYAYTMRLTMAGNVYSFGVILLELVTGKAAVIEGIELAKWVLSNSTRKGNWDHILDYSLSRGSISEDEDEERVADAAKCEVNLMVLERARRKLLFLFCKNTKEKKKSLIKDVEYNFYEEMVASTNWVTLPCACMYADFESLFEDLFLL
ncbi:hypothetical protein LguiA_004781 [Lonicera macranthoides]